MSGVCTAVLAELYVYFYYGVCLTIHRVGRTIYMSGVCTAVLAGKCQYVRHSSVSREISVCTAQYGVYVPFWPALATRQTYE